MTSEHILRLQTGRIASMDEGRLLDRIRADVVPASGALLGLGSLTLAVREHAGGPLVLAATAWRDRACLEEAIAAGGRAAPFGPASDLVAFDEPAEFSLVIGAAEPLGTMDGAAIALVRATIAAEDEARIVDLIRHQHEVLQADGLARALLVGRRETRDGVEIAALGVWPDRDATATYLASRPEGPGLDPRFAAVASALHFEMFDALEPSAVLPPRRVPAVLVLDRLREIVDGSPGVERLLGVPAESLVGRHLDELVAPDELGRLPGRWRLLLELGRETATVMTRRGDVVVPLTHHAVTGMPTSDLCSLLLTERSLVGHGTADALVRRALRVWHPRVSSRTTPRPRLVTVPSADGLFARYVAATLDTFGATTVRRLQLHLRGLHPDAVVHRRALAGERGETWYVYRDGGARDRAPAEAGSLSGDGSMEVDRAGRIVRLDDAAASLLGGDTASFVGRTLGDFTVEGTHEDLALLLGVAFGMPVVDSRLRLLRLDGTPLDLAFHGTMGDETRGDGTPDEPALRLTLRELHRDAQPAPWFAPLCLPPSDTRFIADVENLLERLAPREARELAAELEVRLRVRYPNASARSLGRVTGFGEGTEVLLVDRDGQPDADDEWWLDPDVARVRIIGDRYVEANAAAAELHGVDRAELLRSRAGRYRMSGDDRLLLRDILRRTGSIRTTTTLVRDDGERIAIEFRAVLVARDPLVLELALRPSGAVPGRTPVRRTVAQETV